MTVPIRTLSRCCRRKSAINADRATAALARGRPLRVRSVGFQFAHRARDKDVTIAERREPGGARTPRVAPEC